MRSGNVRLQKENKLTPFAAALPAEHTQTHTLPLSPLQGLALVFLRLLTFPKQLPGH